MNLKNEIEKNYYVINMCYILFQDEYGFLKQ